MDHISPQTKNMFDLHRDHFHELSVELDRRYFSFLCNFKEKVIRFPAEVIIKLNYDIIVLNR